MKRYSIAALMIVVLFCAVAVAALKNASEIWAGVLMWLTVLVLGVSIVGVIYRREGKRAFWLGFLIFGGGYMLIQNVPKLWDRAVEPLPVTDLLSYAHGKLQQWGGVETVPETTQLSRVVANQALGNSVTPSPSVRSSLGYLRLRVALTTRGNLDQFIQVGHSLITLLIALVGGGIAHAFHRTNRVHAA